MKVLKNLSYILTGFTIGHALLACFILLNFRVYEQISLHYSEEAFWYFIFFGLPILCGIIFYLLLKDKSVPKPFLFVFYCVSVIQIGFTCYATISNYNYWGYAFKRPAVFSEVSKADSILTTSATRSNIDFAGLKTLKIIEDTLIVQENLFWRKDLYMGNVERIFMVFQDHSHIHGHLYYYPKVYKDSAQKISTSNLQRISEIIYKDNIIDKGEGLYDTTQALSGVMTEFRTEDNSIFLFAGLNGREVSNDHYPFYEFLFKRENGAYKLVKKQKFYTDIAGIEGIEYANIAPIFSLLLTIIGSIISLIIGTGFLIHSRNTKEVSPQVVID